MCKENVVVAVCTCCRPVLVANCLTSLAQQQIPQDIAFSILVIDNEAAANNEAAVSKFSEGCPFPVHYIHEPRRGIPMARNAAIRSAVELGADWIAMLDDDETADPDWIAMLMSPEYRDTPILYGRHVVVYPQNCKWVVRGNKANGYVEGQSLETAGTQNVRFSRSVAESLSFDESFGFMPGEDVDFFTRARQNGFEIKRTLRAVTRELAHASKITYFGQMKMTYGLAVSRARRFQIYNGTRATFRKFAPDALKHFSMSIACLPAIVFFIGTHPRQYRRYALKAGRQAPSLLGIFLLFWEGKQKRIQRSADIERSASANGEEHAQYAAHLGRRATSVSYLLPW